MAKVFGVTRTAGALILLLGCEAVALVEPCEWSAVPDNFVLLSGEGFLDLSSVESEDCTSGKYQREYGDVSDRGAYRWVEPNALALVARETNRADGRRVFFGEWNGGVLVIDDGTEWRQRD